MTTQEARDKFTNSGLTYLDIGSIEVFKLQELLITELEVYERDSGFQKFTMELEKQRKKDVVYGNGNGSIESCYFHVRGKISPHSDHKPYYYFKRREAISFNHDGFIGFAGELDSKNTSPILKSFDNFIHWLADRVS